jgi:hypothetical protein
MVHATPTRWWLIGLAIAAGFIVLLVFLARPVDPQRTAKRMQAQVAQVRGLPFKRDVTIHEQSREEFQKHAKGRLKELSVPEHEQVMRTLGLLASDETVHPDALGKQIEGNGPAGQYDPYSGRLLVVKASNQPGQQHAEGLDDLYARELYRALVDQQFDLKTYLERRRGGTTLNNDEWLARQLVVEGEAFYGAVLRRARQEMGHIPRYFPLDEALRKHSQTEELMGAMNDPRFRDSLGVRRKPRREPGSLPTFITQLLKGMHQDGVLFVHRVRDRGWDEIDKLYTTSPPVSTEQILHPQKWFVHERPLRIQWPAFETEPAFADWELLEQNVLGELMLRTVFRVHHLSSMMRTAPAGWNGDRYAVFQRRGSGDTLLLLYTAWDRERDASAFAESYRVVVKEKYAEESKPVRILEEGRRVVIVEGGDESTLDAFMRFAQSAQEIEDTAVER